MATIKVKCPYCGSDKAVRYGRNSKTGRERFLCNNSECVLKTSQLENKNHACKPGMREKIVEMVMNGSGTRDTGRVLGVSKDTVTKVLKKRKNLQSQSTKTYLKELEEKKAVDLLSRQVPPGMAVAGGGSCDQYASSLCVWHAGTQVPGGTSEAT